MIFLTETKCQIRFIYVKFNCEREKVGLKWMELIAIKGGGGGGATLNGKCHFEFPFFKPFKEK